MGVIYMAEEWSPIVISATFTPVTANVGDSVLLQVIVLDVQTIEQEEIRLSGEFQSGEV